MSINYQFAATCPGPPAAKKLSMKTDSFANGRARANNASASHRASATFVAGAEILIGMHFLRRYRLEIDVPGRSVVIKRSGEVN
jgi:hypothetical protein